MGDLAEFQLLAQETEDLSFFKHYDKSYKDLPEPCCSNVYRFLKSKQANTCAEMAARFYYNKLYPGQFLHDLEVIDSHTFDRRHYDEAYDKAYFHVNFRAKTPSRANTPSIFFAEISGKKGPEEVNLCVQLGSGEEIDNCTPFEKMDNCKFCTGIWHPPEGFVGCVGPRTKKRKISLAGNSDCAQDGINSSQPPFAAPKPLKTRAGS